MSPHADATITAIALHARVVVAITEAAPFGADEGESRVLTLTVADARKLAGELQEAAEAADARGRAVPA